MFRPYLRVLRAHGALLTFFATFLGSLPIGMLGLSEFLLVQSTTGSVTQAGAVSGALRAGNAGGLIIQGRLIDRRGQTDVLTATSLMCGTALTLLTVAAIRQGPFLLLMVLAAFAGATIPAVITSMRVLIPEIVPSTDLRRTAYALLGTQFNVAMISGPLMVSGLLILAGPSLAVMVAAGAATLAGLAFAATNMSRGWRPAPVSSRGRPPRRPTLTEILTPGMRTLLVAAFGAGLAAGLLSVAVPTVAVSHGAASFAGVLFAASSLGDLLGGLVYGGRPLRSSLRAQLISCQVGSAVVNGLLALVTGHPRTMLPLMFASGAVQAPGGIATSSLLDDVAHRGSLGQSYTSMVAAGLAGGAIGSAAGGTLTNVTSGWIPFAVAAAVTATVAAWTLLRRRTLTSPGRTARSAHRPRVHPIE